VPEAEAEVEAPGVEAEAEVEAPGVEAEAEAEALKMLALPHHCFRIPY
jgi:hypothetical protein